MVVYSARRFNNYTQQPAEKLRPLSSTERLLYPFFAPFLRGGRGEHLRRRYQFTRELHQKQADLRRAEREILREARKFAQLISDRWAQMGYSWRYRWNDGNPETEKRKRRRADKVKWELARYNENAIHLKILVRRKTLFGYKNMLPYKVLVSDLLSEQALREIEFAIDRKVSARFENPRNGAWIVVHRNEGGGLLPRLVHYQHMLPHNENEPDRGSMVLGVGQHNTVYTVNLDEYPHILIGGSSNSGKSNMLNNMLASLIRFCTPAEVQLILIDPKRLELSHYRNAPHLARGIVYEIEEAREVLSWANAEIDRRTALLDTRHCKKISEWNRRYPQQRCARLVIAIEEVASLFSASNEARKDVRALAERIGNMGRAVGLHLIMCTQLPIVEVVPNKIKANMVLAISGALMNNDQSRVILDTGAAARLPNIKGRMIARMHNQLVELQTPLISDEDVRECVDIARGRAAGLIELWGHAPRIMAEKLLAYILNSIEGRLSLKVLEEKLRGNGISRAMLRAFVEDVRRAGRVTVAGVAYQPAKLDRVWQLVRADAALTPSAAPDEDYEDEEADDDEVPPPEAADDDEPPPPIIRETPIRWIEVKPNPPPLPSGEPLSVEELGLLEAETPPVRVQAEAIPDDEAVLHEFIQTKCTIGRLLEVSSSALYAAYSAWCAEQAYQSVSIHKLADLLKNAGFKKKRGVRGQRMWQGLDLENDAFDGFDNLATIDAFDGSDTARTHDSEG
ncbi:MAG: hypothetical protein DYG88_07295 [Chloroflexi bacterium CFX4]|nr:hypothetical protein [Chloroflexi bacterium CFX4]MDL1921981.1 hypothetical protein [Chloroflexi bacterium CFX3]